ncbi:hypothetical protein [Thermococcus sp. 9N3]|uniref:hypothetical protein n=1 Tax=Thermococcus sp. 9N3 TaxID=163002 RepID=UPI003211E484
MRQGNSSIITTTPFSARYLKTSEKLEKEASLRKAELVGLDSRGKSYGLIAKSVNGKEGLRNEGCLVWDLRDFNIPTKGL